MYKKYLGGLLLLFLLVFTLTFTARAQTVPLGDAAKFALLAGGDIRANTAVQAMDYAGAGQSVDMMVTAQTTYLRGETGQALSHLAEAMAYYHNREGRELKPELVDLELEAGVYKASGPAVLGGRIVLQGNAKSVFIFNIAGSLDVKERTQLVLGDVRPENVFWNVQGRVSIEKGTAFTGIVMAADGIDFQVPSGAELALLTQGSITFTAPDPDETIYFSNFYSYDVLSRQGGICDVPFVTAMPASTNSVKGRIPRIGIVFSRYGTDASGQPFTQATWELELTLNNTVYTVDVTVAGSNNLLKTVYPDLTTAFIAKYGFAVPCGSYQVKSRFYNACNTTPFFILPYTGTPANVNCFSIALPDAAVCQNIPATVTAGVVLHPDLKGSSVLLISTAPSPVRWYWNSQRIPNANSAVLTLPASYTAAAGQYPLTVEMDHTIDGHTVTESQSATLTVAPPLQVSVSTQAAQVCSGGSATLTVSNAQAGHTYQICTTGNTIITCSNVAGQTGPMYVTLPFTQYGNYSVTVTDTQLPGCPATVSFTIGGAQTLGAYGQVTTIDAANYPNHTVTFSGDYHVLGHLVFTNTNAATTTGTFNLTPGARFLFAGDGGTAAPLPLNHTSSPNSTVLKVSAATLNLSGAILEPAGCATGGWQGIALTDGAVLNTDHAQVPDSSGGFRTQKTEINLADQGVSSYQHNGTAYVANTNRYYLNNTKFYGGNSAFRDIKKDGLVLAGEGIRNTVFDGCISGIYFEQGPQGDYAPAVFTGNTFSCGVGIHGTANNLKIEGCQFPKVGMGILVETRQQGATSNCYVLNNTFNVAYRSNGQAYGVQTYGGYTVTGNTFTGDAVNAAGTTGILALGDNNTISGNNTFTNLEKGIEAYWCSGLLVNDNTFTGNVTGLTIGCNNTNEFTGNTFTDNQTGIRFGATFQNPFGLPPVVRCNSFSAPNVSNSKGIYIEPNARVTNGNNPNVLGKPTDPNGNKFELSISQPVRNDNSGAPLDYYVFKGSTEELKQAGLTGGTIQLGTAFYSGACPTAPGVHLRTGPARLAASGETVQTAEALGQSYPNPAAAAAIIPYRLPEGCWKATIVIRELVTGRQVQTYALPGNRQKDVLSVDLRRLPNGIYTYSLEAGGRVLATRRLSVIK